MSSELDAVAILHEREISEGFLSTLGQAFLRRLYRRIDRAPGSFILVHAAQGEVEGFIAGSADVRGLYRSFIWRDGLVAGLLAAPRLVRSSREAVETLRHGKGETSPFASGELLSIAVRPESRCQGIGAGLVEAFLAELDRREIRAAHVVVAESNTGAVQLYRRYGFVQRRLIELHAGTRSVLMERRWTTDAPLSTGRVENERNERSPLEGGRA